MELLIRPVITNLFYKATFPEPMSELYRSEGTEALLKRLVKDFGLRLNSIKFNRESLSDNFLHFSKFKGPSWFDVSYGLEEVTAVLNNPLDEEQVSDLYTKLADCFRQYAMSRQQMNLQQQLAVEGDVTSFLESLNPNIPSWFQGALEGRGAFYVLKFLDQQLRTHITVASSLYVKEGLFLSIENDFEPNKYNFKEAFRIAQDHHESILRELGMKLEATG